MCGEPAGSECVCPDCLPILPRIPDIVCPRCGLPVALPGMLCGHCLTHPPFFDETHAVFLYIQPVREMVLALKHARGFPLLDWMAAGMADALTGCSADCLVPVPLHRHRLRERGFNQSCELARRVARRTGLELCPEALVRRTDTPRFSGLHARQRQRQVKGIFSLGRNLSGKSVVVVDDVMTSGATLNEVARVLKQGGVLRVINLVLARTPR